MRHNRNSRSPLRPNRDTPLLPGRLLALCAACLALLTACAAAAGGLSAHGGQGSEAQHITVASLPAREAQAPSVGLTLASRQLEWPAEDGEDGLLAYTIENQAGLGQSFLTKPRLQRRDADGHWQEVPYAPDARFCGTPDQLDADQVVGHAQLSWWQLEEDCAGTYRLGLEVQLTDGGSLTVWDEFTLAGPGGPAA